NVRKAMFAGLTAGALTLCLAGVAAPVGADSVPGGAEGCVTNPFGTSPAGVLYQSSCSYTATRNAGYVANGSDWTVTISRPNGTTTPTQISYSSAAGSPGQCVTAILAGDTVSATSGANSGVAIGNPFPAGAPDLPGTTPGTPCP